MEEQKITKPENLIEAPVIGDGEDQDIKWITDEDLKTELTRIVNLKVGLASDTASWQEAKFAELYANKFIIPVGCTFGEWAERICDMPEGVERQKEEELYNVFLQEYVEDDLERLNIVEEDE